MSSTISDSAIEVGSRLQMVITTSSPDFLE